MVETTLSSHLHLPKCSLSMEQSLNLCLRWFAQGCISSCSSKAHNNASSEISSNHFSLKKEGTRTKRTTKQVENKEKKTKKTEGGILPLAALIPALIAGGKAIGLAAAGAGASYGVKRAGASYGVQSPRVCYKKEMILPLENPLPPSLPKNNIFYIFT